MYVFEIRLLYLREFEVLMEVFPVAFQVYDMDCDGFISNGELFQVLSTA
tara:strand:- start:511 stop:657 length:147 start_codon:yes stop_codon:yes gene_type:complete